LMGIPLTTSLGWDLILCRNVLIYFDQATAVSCARRLAASLSSDGWLFFAAGEMAFSPPEELAPVLMRGRVGFVRSGNLATVSESYGLEPLQKAPLEIQFAGPAASQVAGHQAVSPVAIAEKVEHIPDPSG